MTGVDVQFRDVELQIKLELFQGLLEVWDQLCINSYYFGHFTIFRIIFTSN